jgi:hypothetical protein
MMKKFRFGLALILILQVLTGMQSASATPATPTNVQARVDTSAEYRNGKITVSWDAVSGANAYSVLLTREDDRTTERQSVTGEQNNSAQFTGLMGGKSYIVQVRSIVVDQASAWSADTLKAVAKTAPMAPAKPTVTVTVGTAAVSWTAVASADSGGFDITSYIVREVTSGTSVTAAATATSANVTGLTAGSSVEFTVTAVNAANTTGTTSTKSDAATLPSVPAVMTAPSMVTSATNGEAGVTWTAPASNGGSAIVSYTVKLLRSGVDLVSRVITDLTNLSTLFDGLATGSYSAKVASTNGVGTSAFSLESTAINVTRLVPVDTSTPTTPPTSNPPSSNPPSTGGGGGGGGGVGTTWFNLFVSDPDAPTQPYPGNACAIFIHRLKEGDKEYGPICASKAGALDFEANDGEYLIRTFVKDQPDKYKEYRARITFGTFEVVGAGYRGGSVPRRIITLLTQSEMAKVTPSPTPTPSATATPTPSAKPTPSASPSASASASASPAASAAPKPRGFVVGGKVTGAVRPSTLSAAKSKVTLKLSANFQAIIPSVKKGEKITMVIKDPKGKSLTVANVTAAKAGTVKLPSVKFSIAGKYTITVKVGSKTKVVTLTATK